MCDNLDWLYDSTYVNQIKCYGSEKTKLTQESFRKSKLKKISSFSNLISSDRCLNIFSDKQYLLNINWKLSKSDRIQKFSYEI